ncbi:MAG: aminotransferase class IV [Candidatus Pseudobacter hemicellulosilyticus]|uniref:branched-chain-amino-acid transaminase n=1 Tax=Candidatus Pseudobacter hemicellulosilyticus TaxID=3121375 RepID=A0AAJ5WRT8_9BACT|nr:MAG: aminotransferase class IV [Pseudobacter sp.]
MGKYLSFNGRILEEQLPLVSASNRGLRYGDGLFETMKLIRGEIRLAPLHFDRLFRGLSLLRFDIPAFFSAESITADILRLCQKNKCTDAARIRLSVFRGNGGLYDAENLLPNLLIQAWPLEEHRMVLNSNGLRMDVYSLARKSCDVFAGLKTNNYLPSIMAALYAKEKRLNDCFLLNTWDRICDASIANVWWVRNGHIFTPPLSEGAVAGVMRQYLLQEAGRPGTGLFITEQPLQPDELEQADEVFLTNAISGIRWVQSYRQKDYGNQLATTLFNQFVQPLNHSRE